MNKLKVIAASILVLAVIAFFFWPSSEPKEDAEPGPEPSKGLPSAKRARSAPVAPPGMPQLAADEDPEGPLLLEGLVLEDDGTPVVGAKVQLASNPPRTTTSGEDGTFSFDKLIPRDYTLAANTETLIGGPIVHRLSAESDPAVVHMQAGGKLTIVVVDETQNPIESATITVDDSVATSDAQGRAALTNLRPGGNMASASAKGYASSRVTVQIDDDASTANEETIVLRRGARVSGLVVGPDDKPVAKASVSARSADDLFQLGADHVTTNDQGEFVLEAVAFGSTRIIASHKSFAPASSETLEVTEGGIDGLRLRLAEGASVAGKVVDAQGKPVPWAEVRLVGKTNSYWNMSGSSRQVIADEDGRFSIEGLDAKEMLLHASSITSTSEIVELNLGTEQHHKDVTIKLLNEGIIAGVVVDEHGEPVEEAQVMINGDFWKGADIQRMMVTGPRFATTDGGGRFEIRGLPTGSYRAHASRGLSSWSNWGGPERGVEASTGTTNLRLVLQTPSVVVGKIQIAEGGIAEQGIASIGSKRTMIQSGEFRITDVAPGTHTLSVRGPSFEETMRANLVVRPGETLDVGTVVVHRGRLLSGRVVDASGRAVAGAQVVVGRQVVSDSDSLTLDNMGSLVMESMGVKQVVTDDSGEFRLRGIGDKKLTVVAEHSEAGRSLAVEVAGNPQDVEVTLALAKVGSARGRVTVNGAPQADLGVMIAPVAGLQHIVMVQTDPNGQFAAKRLAPGEYKVSAMNGMMGSASMTSKVLTVRSGQISKADLDIQEGSLTLRVMIGDDAGTKPNAAQVFLFPGRVNPKTGGDINRLFTGSASDAKMAFAPSGDTARFEKVVPGSYSLCVIGIYGDMNDPAFAEQLQDQADTLPVHCRASEIAAAPAEQELQITLPPPPPLPEKA